VSTDADGRFALGGLPPDERLVLTMTKEGWIPLLKTIETTNTDVDGGTPSFMTPLEAFEMLDYGVDIDWETHGAINFFAIGSNDGPLGFGPFLGSKVSITPADGDGPIYLGEDGMPDLTAESTKTYGGAFLNLPEGDYELTFTPGSPAECAAISAPWSGWGWPTGGDGTVKTRVVAGHWTWAVGVLCTPLSGGGDGGPAADGGSDAGALADAGSAGDASDGG
jgi:hypothetical protein